VKRYIIRVSGKVQGVFFRASTKKTADQLGLSGLARNEPDGSVYIEVEGRPEILEVFAAWCKMGPIRAQVVTFVIEEADPKGYVGFNIQHR
jgi:acylphosphatase